MPVPNPFNARKARCLTGSGPAPEVTKARVPDLTRLPASRPAAIVNGPGPEPGEQRGVEGPDFPSAGSRNPEPRGTRASTLYGPGLPCRATGEHGRGKSLKGPGQ